MIILLLILGTFLPPIILLMIGARLNREQSAPNTTFKIFAITAVVYLIVAMGYCGTILLK